IASNEITATASQERPELGIMSEQHFAPCYLVTLVGCVDVLLAIARNNQSMSASRGKPENIRWHWRSSQFEPKADNRKVISVKAGSVFAPFMLAAVAGRDGGKDAAVGGGNHDAETRRLCEC